MKTVLAIFFSLFLYITGFAQNEIIHIIGTSGGQYITDDIMLDFTIGSTANDLNSTNYAVNIGFQQPEYSKATALNIDVLKNFTAIPKNHTIYLAWETDNLNLSDFVIEHSKNAHDWIVIGKVKGQFTNSNYLFTHQLPSTDNFYRLKQQNSNQQLVVISPTISVFLIQETRIYPNPTKDVLYVDPGSDTQIITILNAKGEKISTFKTVSSLRIDLSGYPKGSYFVISENLLNLTKETHSFILQ